LQALLRESGWQLPLALAALFVDRHDDLIRLIPSLREKVPGKPELETWYPSSFWIARSGASARSSPRRRPDANALAPAVTLLLDHSVA
jgi:hypothetical protein